MQIDDKKLEVTSKQFWLNYKDLFKGLVITVIGAALTVVQTSLEAGVFHINWKEAAIIGVTAGVSYLLKNFFQPAQVKADVTNKEAAEIIRTKSPEPAAK